MVYCVRIKEGSWYELVEGDHCDTTTLEDDVFYSDTESAILYFEPMDLRDGA